MVAKPQPSTQAPTADEFPPVTAEEAAYATLENLRDVAPVLDRDLKAGVPRDKAIADAIIAGRQAFAYWLFFVALSPDRHPIPVDDWSDAVDVLANRGGTIGGVIAEVKSGKFRNWPRDDEGTLIFPEDNAADTAG